MKTVENNRVRVTLEEARKLKGRSNPAQILVEQKKEQTRDKKK